MKRPSALIEANPLSPPIANSPEASTDTASVWAVHPDGALVPLQRSRTKRFIVLALDSEEVYKLETRFVALDSKTTNLPSALIAT
jgi:hypothetical protein